jgi:hypothetical protein
MIRGLHGLFYSSEPDALRAFLKDKLQLPHTDVGGGWLIFDLPEADLGVHPTDDHSAATGTHDVSFYCDDLKGTVAELTRRGVEFDEAIADHGYGFVTYFTMPGRVRVQLYEPKYQKRTAPPAAKAAGGRPKAAKAKRARAKPARQAAKRGAKPRTAAAKKGGRKPAARRTTRR